MRRTLSIFAASGVLATGLGLGLAAQQKPAATPAAGAQPKVSVYKSPT
jgi:hypothetical protein